MTPDSTPAKGPFRYHDMSFFTGSIRDFVFVQLSVLTCRNLAMNLAFIGSHSASASILNGARFTVEQDSVKELHIQQIYKLTTSIGGRLVVFCRLLK